MHDIQRRTLIRLGWLYYKRITSYLGSCIITGSERCAVHQWGRLDGFSVDCDGCRGEGLPVIARSAVKIVIGSVVIEHVDQGIGVYSEGYRKTVVGPGEKWLGSYFSRSSLCRYHGFTNRSGPYTWIILLHCG